MPGSTIRASSRTCVASSSRDSSCTLPCSRCSATPVGMVRGTAISALALALLAFLAFLRLARFRHRDRDRLLAALHLLARAAFQLPLLVLAHGFRDFALLS